jgi:autotransporter-associated beta strand protein
MTITYTIRLGRCFSSQAACAFAACSVLSVWGITWDGGGADNKFSTAGNWDPDGAVTGISSLPIVFDALVPGGQSTALVDVSGNSSTWTFNAGASAMTVTVNSAGTQLGAAAGQTLVVNNSPYLQTLAGSGLRIFDIGGTTASRIFNAAAGDLSVPGFDVRGDSSPASWVIDLTAASGRTGTITGAINPSGLSGKTVTVAKNGDGTWELKGALPNLGNAGSPAVNAGLLVLSAANTFSANTRVAGGALRLNHASAMQSSTLDMNAADAGVLDFGSAITEATLGGLQGSRGLSLANTSGGAVTLSAGNNNASTTYSGVLSGDGGLTKVGSGTLTLGANASFTGAAAVNGGYLAINGVSRLATASGLAVSGGQLKCTANGTYANVPLTLTGDGPNSQGALHFNVNSAVIAWPGAITLNGGSRIGAYSGGGAYTFSSAIGGTGNLNLWGGGGAVNHLQTFVLNAACGYSGNTTIEATYGGNTIVQLGVDDGLPATTSLLLNSYFWSGAQMLAELKLNGRSQTLAGLANTGAGVQRVVNGSATAATLTVNTAAASTFSGCLGGPNANENNLSLVKSGTGTLTLSGTNTLSGGVTVSNGTLFANGVLPCGATVSGGTLAGAGVVTGSVSVASGGTLNPGGGPVSAGTLTVQGDVSLASGAAVEFDLAGTATVGGGVNDLVQLTGSSRNLTLNGNPVTINPLTTLATGVPYTIITFTGTRSGTLGAVSGVGRQPVAIQYDDTPGAGQITLTFAATAAGDLVWSSNASGAWDVLATANWSNTVSHVAPDVFYPFDHVVFDDTPGVQTDITVNETVTPTSVTVQSDANDFTFSGTGKISGFATLTKEGASTLTVGTTNDYTGETVVSGGTLRLSGGPNRLPPASAVTLADAAGATLDLNDDDQTVAALAGGGAAGGSVTLGAGNLTVATAGTPVFAGAISGAGTLIKSGAGTLTLAGANAYVGGTTISAGTLALGGSGTLGAPEAALNALGGVLDLGGTSQAVGTVTVAGGTIRNGVLAGSAYAGQSGTVSAMLTGEAALTKTGDGTLTLSGTNDYTGGTVLSAGNLMLSGPGVTVPGDLANNGGNVLLGANEQVADTTVLLFGAGISGRLQMQGFDETVGGVQDVGGTGIRIVEAASDGVGGKPATLTLNVTGTCGFGGYVRDASGASGSLLTVVKNGPGTQTFSGSAALVSYSGATVVNGGLLEFSGPDSAANNSAIILNGGAVQFSGGTRGSTLSGAGNVTKVSANTLTLSGNSSHVGVTTLGGGDLVAATLADGGATCALGASDSAATNLVFAGGNLVYSGLTDASSDRNYTINAAATAGLGVSSATNALTLTGSAPATTGHLKKTGAGTLTLAPGEAGGYTLGSLSADGGTLVLKSGAFATTGANPDVTAYNAGAGARGGTLAVDGAALTVPQGRSLKIGANATGNLNILSGTVNAYELVVGHNGTVAATQSGGEANVTNLFHYDGGQATYTLTGGTLTTRRIYNFTQIAGAGFTLNLNGGVLRAAPGTVNLLDNGGRVNGVELTVRLGGAGGTLDTGLSGATLLRPLDDSPGQAGVLTKIGAGTLTLAGTNTYSGSTVVSNGVLRLTHAQCLSAEGDVVIASGAHVALDFEGTNVIRRLIVNGVLKTIDHVYGAGNLPSSLTGTGYLLTTEGEEPKGTLLLMR